MTRIVQMAKKPRLTRQLDVIALDVELRAKYRDPKQKLDVLLIPAFVKIFDLHDRQLASLRCARLAIGAENFRRDHRGRWPDNMNQLVPACLVEVPLDPFKEGPLRYTRLNDGVLIYSAGPNQDDEPIDPEKWQRHGTDPFFRLWDLDRRGPTPD